ncbi:ANTAR domain-containing protein [Streptomyces sp. NPDC020298]|uniref:ANTAR domain-containing protein n=1 Tax=unclassified Streptomyces TaxID=2593676 RepID=UPI0033CD337B
MAFFTISRHRPLVLLSSTDLAMEYERLAEESAQLRQAVTSHAVIDQAIGVVVAVARIAPEEGWRVLIDVSQRTNTKLRTVADHILDFGQGGTLPEPILTELGPALDRHGIRCRVEPPQTHGQ